MRNLQQERLNRRISPEAAAAAMGVTTDTIKNWERDPENSVYPSRAFRIEQYAAWLDAQTVETAA